MKVRSLNPSGREKLVDYLHEIKSQQNPKEPPKWLLEDKDHSSALNSEVKIQEKEFDTQYKLGEYLDGIFTEFEFENLMDRDGVWNWLSLYFIDQLCPKKADGTRKTLEIDNYVIIPKGGNRSKKYKHIIATAFYLYHKYQNKSKLYLYGPLDEHGDMLESIMGVRKLYRNENAMEAIYKIYYDPERERPKKGATNKKKNNGGVVRRFRDTYNQYYLTYDLFDMESEEIIDLLPEEFDPWI